jgi:2,4-dichlorophenol 6-monooxygenase
MADITTDVLIIGTGPAGSATAALLSTYGVENMVINRYRWLANTPRAHITNQRAMEVLRDLGPEVEAEAYLYATEQDLMGENIFCTSLAGEELGRMRSWGKHPLSRAAHQLASPSFMNDLPQTYMEPILFKTACSRGTQARMSTEYLSHVQDAEGVTTTCRDRLTGRDIAIRSKYLVGADGGKSLVAEHAGLPFAGKMGVAGSMNILFKADLSKYVAHRPSVLYWVLQPGSNVGGIGMGLVRMVRPWNEWLIVWGYDINEGEPKVDAAFALKVARDLVGDHTLEIELQSASTWTVNNLYATEMSKGRVFCMGDATHRHPPSNGLGSNTSIQDGFNLAWKLAYVLKGQAGPKLLDSYSTERAPVAKQIVTRANQSIEEFGPIFKALGLLESIDPVKMQENMDARCDDTPAAEAQREAIRKAIAFKVYEFDAHGVDMNQRYRSDAVVTDGEPEPPYDRDRELHYQPTTWPGARLPHVWVYGRDGRRASTLDLAGKGRFAIFTGIGGEGWIEAGRAVGKELGLDIAGYVIGPRQDWEDYAGDWANAREVRDSGIVLVRPDQHVAWRRETIAGDPAGELRRVLNTILDR